MGGKHTVIQIECSKCSTSFNRRRCTRIRHQVCPRCIRRSQGRLDSLPTKLIETILRNDGSTDKGTDMSMYIEELKEILCIRQYKALEKEMIQHRKQLKQQAQEEDNHAL